jgi:formylglycine-generating enzyme required for sulfatase activity
VDIIAFLSGESMVRIFLSALSLTVIACLLACSDDSQNVFHVDVISHVSDGRDIEMVSLPGGTYAMGSDFYPARYFHLIDDRPIRIDTILNSERPVHFVSVSPFMISSTEITHEQFQAVMDFNPSYYIGMTNMPVENVKWRQAVDFCNGLSELMGLSLCYDEDYNCDFDANGFRLPTEAEWEFASIGGTDQEFSFGDSEANLIPYGEWELVGHSIDDTVGIVHSSLARYGWYRGNSESKPSPVAYKEPNQYGLYDMHGNVSEWCQDIFDMYNCNTQVDPITLDGVPFHVVRGGSWASSASDCRSAARIAYYDDWKVSTLGFRIVRRQ